MPWVVLPTFEASNSIAPSFMANNLAADGDGRLAFVQGHRVRFIRRMAVSSKRNDFSLANLYVQLRFHCQLSTIKSFPLTDDATFSTARRLMSRLFTGGRALKPSMALFWLLPRNQLSKLRQQCKCGASPEARGPEFFVVS